MSRDPRNRNKKSKLSVKITLYVVGIALIITALLILLKQIGVLSSIPSYVYIVALLIVVGVGILAGLNND